MKHIHKSLKATVMLSAVLLFLVFVSSCSNTTKSEDPGQAPTDKSGETNIPAVTNNEPEPASKSIESAPTAKAESGSLVRIVFITTSRACACTLTRCKNAESSLQKAMTKHPKAPKLERLDYAREPERVRKLISKYTAMMLPIIYFIDQDGNLLDGLEGDFYEEDINEILGKYAGGKH